MAHLAFIDLLGFWLGIFLTCCILSFLYKDNPVYKFAEHLFIGVSIGYVVTKQYYDTLRPKLVQNLAEGHWIYLVGLLLSAMLLMKLSRRWGWLGRFPIAFVVAFYAGIQINGAAQGDLGAQIDRAMEPVTVYKVNINDEAADRAALSSLPGLSPLVADRVIAGRPLRTLDDMATLPGISADQAKTLREERGSIAGTDAQVTLGSEREIYWFGTFSQVLLLLGLLAGLMYFYFSLEQKGAVGRVSRLGVWVLMVDFGASFGYTVQGRIALAIGRARDVLGHDKDPRLAEQIHGSFAAVLSIVAIVITLVIWERRRRAETSSTSS